MKKGFKLLLVVFITLLVFSGCGKKDKTNDENNTKSELDVLNEKIKIEDMGIITGNYGVKSILFKISNSNSMPLTVNTTVSLCDSSGKVLYSRDLYNYVGSYKYSYGVLLLDAEDEVFSKYKLDTKVSKDDLTDYDSIYSGINVSAFNNGKNVVVTFTNNSSRMVTPTATVLFLKGDKIVDVEEVTSYHLKSAGVDNININYPMINSTTKMDYDKIQVMLKEVDLKL